MRRSLDWLLLVVGLGLLLAVVTEIWLLLWMIGRIGFFLTLVLLVVAAGLGVALLRREGTKAWHALSDALATGHMPQGQIADAALVLLGGLLLVVPGFISDAFGLLLIAPVTRPLIRSMLGYVVGSRRQRSSKPIIIEGEVEADEPKSVPTLEELERP